MKYGAILFLLTAIVGLSAAESHAQYGYGWGFSPYQAWLTDHVQTDRQIPYFAQHPPVYYSGIVPRTYGQSPYAYPPCNCNGVGVETEVPLIVPNPHFEEEPKPAEETSSKLTSTRRRVQPLVVENPYFDSSPRIADASLTN
jgi:hypothetical protein